MVSLYSYSVWEKPVTPLSWFMLFSAWKQNCFCDVQQKNTRTVLSGDPPYSFRLDSWLSRQKVRQCCISSSLRKRSLVWRVSSWSELLKKTVIYEPQLCDFVASVCVWPAVVCRWILDDWVWFSAKKKKKTVCGVMLTLMLWLVG